jgi:hypothetical protein
LRHLDPGSTATLCAFNKRWRAPVLTNDVAKVTCHMCMLKLREIRAKAAGEAMDQQPPKAS